MDGLNPPEDRDGAHGWDDLADALGPVVMRALGDPAHDDATDIRRRPDGAVMVKRRGAWRREGHMGETQARRACMYAAGHAGRKIRPDLPRCSAVLPGTRGRMKMACPPVAESWVFTIRRPSAWVWPLEGYPAAGIMSEGQLRTLVGWVESGVHVLFAGRPGAGKTSLLNSVFRLPYFEALHTYCVEDDPELVLPADSTRMLADDTLPVPVTQQVLVADALRWAPDVIAVGEARGPEGLQIVEAGNTGMQLFGTLHASGAREIPDRVLRLVEMNRGVTVGRMDIVQAVHAGVFLVNEGGRPRVAEMVRYRWDDDIGRVSFTSHA